MELRRDDRHDRAEPLRHAFGHRQRPATDGSNRGQVRDDGELGAVVVPEADEHLGHARLGRSGWSDRQDRHVLVDEREWAVEEIRRRVRIGEHPRELLELERPLPGGRVLEASTEDEDPIGGSLGRGDPLDFGLDLEGLGDRRRQRRERDLVGGAGARVRIERGCEQGDRHELGGVRLGGGDGVLGAGGQVDDVLGRRCERRRRIVGDGKGRLALIAGRLDHGDDVR